MSEESVMSSTPRPLQFFLDPSGVSTVHLAKDKHTLTCDCPASQRKDARECRHILWVRERVDPRTGDYPVQVSKRAPAKEMAEAFSGASSDNYRDFMLKYGRVEVLD